jgi:hypothetical protein
MESAKILALFGLAALAGASGFARIERQDARAAWLAARAEATPGRRVQAGRGQSYVGSQRCRACHPAAWESWHDSFHRTMTQLGDPDVVLAHATTLPDGARLERSDAGASWLPADGGESQPIVMTTGAHHMQIYWAANDEGLLQALPYAWLVDDARFVPNEATLLRPVDDGIVYTWNRVCIRCHAVAGSPGWDERTGAVDTKTAELGIACEACHGPGHRHAEAHASPWSRALARAKDGDPTIVQPARLDAAGTNDVCGQCHAITVAHDEAAWLRRGSSHAPPDPLAKTSALVRHPARADLPWLDDVLAEDADFLVDRFWSDGHVRVTGRELNGLVESKCHDGGELSCLSCHSMHAGTKADQLAPPMDGQPQGDAACTQCHAALDYATVEHTHHPPDATGARCLNCHMPKTSWGLLGAVRSHTIDIPDVRTSLEVGRPDACSLCHLDRELGWSAEWLERWYGRAVPDSLADAPFAEAPAAVRWLLAGDAGQRALAAWHMGEGGDPSRAALLVELFDDPYPAVRLVAWRSVARLLGDRMPDIADGALPDPEFAARVRAIVPRDRSPAAYAIPAMRAARDDRRVALAE